MKRRIESELIRKLREQNRGARVLVVDDDLVTLRVISVSLQNAGYEVQEASSGRETLERVRNRPPELVLLDVNLPDMNGREVCRQIKSDPELSRILVIHHSDTEVDTESQVHGLVSGADAYITHPASPDELVARVDALVRLKRSEETLRRWEERYQSLVSNTHDVIFGLAPDGTIRSVNDAFEGITGWPGAEWLGQSFQGLLHPDDLPVVLDGIKRSLAGDTLPLFESRVRSQSGRYLLCEFTTTPVQESGKVVGVWGIGRDITGRKQAEAALRESEQRFREFAENIQEVFWMTNPEKSQILYVSPGYEKIWGRSCESLYARPDSWLETIHPEDRDRVIQAAVTKQARGDYDEQYRIVRPDGDVRWIHDRAFPVRDPDGKVYRIAGVAEEITGRQQAEEALRLSEQRFGTTFRESPVALAVSEFETGRFIEINGALLRLMHGTSFDQMVHRTSIEIGMVTADERKKIIDALQKSGRVDRLEIAMHRLDGEPFLSELSLSYYELDGKRYLLTNIVDITERKRAVEALRAVNARYARHEAALTTLTRSYALQSDSLTPVLKEITEVVAKTLEVDRISIWRYNVDKTSIVRHELFEAEANRHSSGTELKAETYPLYFRALAGSDVIAAHDACHDPRTAEFSESYLRPLGINSMLDAPIHLQGDLVGTLCCEHIGPLRQWTPDEQTFAVAVANLVSGLLAQIERQRLEEQLRQSQKMEAVGQLAGGVAHDFNNILAAMMMQADLAGQYEGLPPEVQEFLNELKVSAERAASLTRQLLAFSRRQVMQPRQLDLNDIVTSLAKMLQRILGEDVRMQLALHPTPLITCADAGMIDQVLMNLAVNARDAMPNGGRLIIETAEKVITEEEARLIPEASPGRYVCLRVSDTGCGIPPENLSRIFEPFFTTKEPGKGTGLGLATVFGIVKQHRGALKFHSEVGQGTTFQIFLVAGDASIESLGREAAKPKPRGGTETLLVVEDDPAVRILTRIVLERHGYQVLEASNGVEALRIWEQHEGAVHLLLTDVVMPEGVSGRELASQLQGRQPGLKVIFTSGYSAELAGQALRLQEGQNFLQKPCPPPLLLETVRKCLDG